MAVLTADHMIENVACSKIYCLMRRNSPCWLFGNTRNRPYPAIDCLWIIQRGQKVESAAQLPVYQVERFREKPDLATAEMMLKTGCIPGIRACSFGR
jgi:mannose-1-phosphate guanylyltransferase